LSQCVKYQGKELNYEISLQKTRD